MNPQFSIGRPTAAMRLGRERGRRFRGIVWCTALLAVLACQTKKPREQKPYFDARAIARVVALEKGLRDVAAASEFPVYKELDGVAGRPLLTVSPARDQAPALAAIASVIASSASVSACYALCSAPDAGSHSDFEQRARSVHAQAPDELRIDLAGAGEGYMIVVRGNPADSKVLCRRLEDAGVEGVRAESADLGPRFVQLILGRDWIPASESAESRDQRVRLARLLNGLANFAEGG